MLANHLLNLIAQADTLTADPNFSDVHPDSSVMPGGAVAKTILAGVMYFSLLFTIGGLVVAAGVWAVGSFSANYTQSVAGKKGFMVCAGSALFIGAAYFLVSWFYGQGTTVTANPN